MKNRCDTNARLSGGKVDSRVDVARLEQCMGDKQEFAIIPSLIPEKSQCLLESKALCGL